MSNPETRLVRRTFNPSTRATPQARKALVSGGAGSILEWFDFAVYGAMSASVFPIVFFSGSSPAMAGLLSFATFGVGIFARPLGGIFFGYLGDRLGRRTVLLATFILMGISSAAIGFLPSYGGVGFIAPLLLVTARFLQGFALGGEATGAQLMTMEHAPRDRRAFYAAIMAMGSPASQVLANGLLALLTFVLSENAFLSWGWRIPFLMSFALVLVGIYIRLKVEETPVFKEGRKSMALESANPAEVIRTYWPTLIRLILAYSPIVVTFYIISVFGIRYLTTEVGFTRNQTFTIIMVANVVAVAAIFIGGRLADIYGRIRILLLGGIGCLGGALVFFPIADTGNFPLVLLATTVILSLAQFGNAGHGAMCAEAFATQHRYTGSALALTGANLVFAGPLPFLAQWLTESVTDGSTVPITIVWVGVIVIAIVCMSRFMSEGPTLEGEPQVFGRWVTPEYAALVQKDAGHIDHVTVDGERVAVDASPGVAPDVAPGADVPAATEKGTAR
ncbi:transporter [Actinomycetales bacterium JB111]|nr:transporter [Actinomycetales bacterium JB111]